MKRLVYRVRAVRGGREGWVVIVPTGQRQAVANKRTAVSMARRWARDRWEIHGLLSQLVVHGRDGRIQYEATYGRDPRSRRG